MEPAEGVPPRERFHSEACHWKAERSSSTLNQDVESGLEMASIAYSFDQAESSISTHRDSLTMRDLFVT